MRRFGILLLTVVLVCALSVSAFADGSKTITDIAEELPVLDVHATYSQGASDVAYSLDIYWGNMEFKYTVEADTWNPDKHEWIVNNNGQWSVVNDSNWITIANDSSVPVKATFAYTAKTGYEAIQGEFTSENGGENWAAADNALTMPFAGEGVKATVYRILFNITDGALVAADDGKVVGSIGITLDDVIPTT